MGFFDIFSGGPFDFDGNGRTDPGEMALGLIMLDDIQSEEKERKKREFVNELLQNAAVEGLSYSPEEIEQIVADSERLGLFG